MAGRGSRASRKAQTRRSLSEAALELFAELGYDQTTVARIAERVGVSERAFFLHFAAKADALFDLSADDLADLRARIRDAPLDEPDLRVLERTTVAWHEARGEPARRHRYAKLLLRAVASSATLRGKQFDYNEVLVDACAAALAARKGRRAPNLTERTAAVVVLRLLHESYLEWARGDRPQGFAAIARRHFRALARTCGDAGNDNGKPPVSSRAQRKA